MQEHIGSIASLIGSLTVVGSALIWIYNKFIGEPRERNRQEEETLRHKRMIEVVTKENEPLNKSIKQLTEWLNESKVDRENLNTISKINSGRLDEHEEQLDQLTDRVIVLETINKVKKSFQYQGGN